MITYHIKNKFYDNTSLTISSIVAMKKNKVLETILPEE